MVKRLSRLYEKYGFEQLKMDLSKGGNFMSVKDSVFANVYELIKLGHTDEDIANLTGYEISWVESMRNKMPCEEVKTHD